MATSTGTAKIIGSQSSSNPAESVYENITNGSKHVVTKGESTWSYGTWPEYLYSYESTTGTAAAALTVSNIQGYKSAIVVISGLTSETVTITGTNGSGNPQALLQADMSTATTALGNGTYYLTNLVCTDLVFTKSSTSESVTIDVDLKAV